MSDPTPHKDGDTGARSEEERVRRLLEEAGPRPEVPAEDLAAIKTAFRAEWAEHVRDGTALRNRSHLSRPLLALAAVLLVTLGLGGWWWRTAGPATAETVARVEVLDGAVTARAPGDVADGERDGKAVLELAVDLELPAGVELVTGAAGSVPGRTAMRLAGGASLRLDTGSRARLLSGSEIELAKGAVYVDTGADTDTGASTGMHDALRIHTPLGVVRDVGTRFEVRLLDAGGEKESGLKSATGDRADALRVRVREGRVDLRWDATTDSAEAGEELTLHADGSLDRNPVALHGPAWDWVLQVAPVFEIEGRTLAELLAWVTRETGWEIRYGDPALADAAGSIVLHGSLGAATPDQAPQVVLPGAGLRSRLEDGVLVVAR